ncbi:MAG: hypothetical protein NUV64_02035 [Parcubacteria group bacterium]|nr:hypothetical protein [Parcubacteria group bacterium]MCR4342792.1 hypothetical protein [Patescibacteria group bacterium]
MEEDVMKERAYERCDWARATMCGAWVSGIFFIFYYLVLLLSNDSKVALESALFVSAEVFVSMFIVVRLIIWIDLKMGF